MNRAARRLAVAAWLALPWAVWAADLPALAGEGQRLFAERCAECHALAPPAADRWLAAYDSKGPPLDAAGDKFDAAYLQRWLGDPVSVRGGTYPYFRWTQTSSAGDVLPQRPFQHPALAPAAAQAVVAFLMTQHVDAQPLPPVAPVAPTMARVLFEKVAACAGCHASTPGEASRSGPQLAQAGQRYKPAWLSSYLHDPQAFGSLTMPKARLRTDQVAGLVAHVLQPADGAAAPVAAAAAGGNAAPEPDRHSRGALIYRMLCTQCHGLNGDGRGINARHLAVEPRNHSAAEMARLSDEHLVRVIRYGGTAVDKSALMPSWASVLREDEIRDVVAHLRTLRR